MSLNDKTVAELIQIAKDNNIRFQRGVKKQEIIDTLEVHMRTQELNYLEEEFFDTTGGQDGVLLHQPEQKVEP